MWFSQLLSFIGPFILRMEVSHKISLFSWMLSISRQVAYFIYNKYFMDRIFQSHIHCLQHYHFLKMVIGGFTPLFYQVHDYNFNIHLSDSTKHDFYT